jgi:hypothetical protein
MDKIKSIIEQKGGKFIGESFVVKSGRKRKVIEFECENGHVTKKRTDGFHTWCVDCTRNDISQARSLAKKRKGKFLSKTYVNTQTSYLWQCEEGHQFKARYYNIHAGKWCPKCRTVTYDDAKQLFDTNGWELLEYNGTQSKVKLKCPQGHIWNTRYKGLKTTPCPKCKTEAYYARIRSVVLSKKGILLTPEQKFEGTSSKLQIQCEKGHVWNPYHNAILNGSWCPQCQKGITERTCRRIFEYVYKKKFPTRHPDWLNGLELDGYCEELGLGFEYNGEQHYKRIPYWHKTEQDFLDQQERDRLTREGCLDHNVVLVEIPYTVPYYDLYTYILHHSPNVPPDTPESIDYEDLSILNLNDSQLKKVSNYVCKHFQGNVISKVYKSNTTPLTCQCKNGHVFQSTWKNIQGNRFCKECRDEDMRSASVTQIINFEKARNVKLLDTYKNNYTLYRWKCIGCGNEWSQKWKDLKKRHTPVTCCQ